MYDVVVVGAGVFGALTAYQLRRAGLSVALLDAYGAGNSRASSGGESRVLRMGYGPDEIYTEWAQRARGMWIELFERVKRPELFQPTGVLWTPPPGDARARSTEATFRKFGVAYQSLTPAELRSRFPQIRFSSERMGILELESGALLARRAVQAVVQAAIESGVEYRLEAMPAGSGEARGAATFVYACGPWLPKIFPKLLRGRIRPTRQEVFFFGSTSATSTARTRCRISRAADSNWLSTVTGRSSIPTATTGRQTDWRQRGPSWANASPRWPLRRWWNRACASMRTLRTAIF
jgi:sarcosine oxidase